MKFNFFRKDKPVVLPVSDSTDYEKNDSEFKFVFNDTVHPGIRTISIGQLTQTGNPDSLVIYKNEAPFIKLDLYCPYKTWDRKEAVKFNRFAAIGVSAFVFLFDLSTQKIALLIDTGGYFERFKISGEYLLIAYHSGIYCVAKYGKIKWHNYNVGVDGVIITEIREKKIYGSEQIDPPDGWKDFVLDLETGNRIS